MLTNLKARVAALCAVAIAAGGLALAAALPASATTADCLSAYGSACGTFMGHDAASNPVFWDNRGQVNASGAVIIGYSANSTSDPATDFTKVHHIGKVPGMGLSDQNTMSWSFVYTPKGVWTNLCIADLNNGDNHLVLRPCNGLQWQRFIAQGASQGTPAQQVSPPSFNGDYVPGIGIGTFAFQNAASRKWITDASTVNPGVRPAGTDTRQLVDAGAQFGSVLGQFGSNQVWTWQK